MTTTATPTQPGLGDEFRRLREELARAGLAKTVHRVAHTFSTNGLIIYASAIAFRIVFALIPTALFAVALLGFLDLEHVWRDSIAPDVRDRTSDAAYTLIDRTVTRALTTREGFWLTAGAAFALWEVSGAIRVTMRALDRIFGERSPRSGTSRFTVSFALAVPIGACLLGALAAAQLVPQWVERNVGGLVGAIVGRAIGWGLGALLVALAVSVILRYAPSSRQPFRLVGTSSIFVISAWTVSSALFGIYATQFASYGSVFGGLAVLIILLTYIHLSAITFLAGIQLDAHLRGPVEERTKSRG